MKKFYLKSFFLVFSFLLPLAGCAPRDASPPIISLFPSPNLTHHPIFSLRGTKTPGTAVLINDQVVIPFDNTSFWSGEVNLATGNNTLLVKSVNSFGNESSPIRMTVTLDTTPPSSPVITSPSPLTSMNSPVSMQGTKDPDTDVLLNGKEIVSFTPSNLWSYTYSPLQVTTPLQLTSKNKLGNLSPPNAATLVYTGALSPAPPLIAPLDGESFKSSAATNLLLFAWTNTGSSTYRIQISNSPDFATPLTIDFSNIHTSPYTLIDMRSILLPGIYYWRVGAYDSSSNLFFSSPRNFFYGKVTGDFNGDGYADILVGAEGTKGPGQVKVFFGRNGYPNLTPDLVLQGENGQDLFGTALAAGDLNGDGYDDIIVGAYHNSAGGDFAGRVYLYFGGPTLHTTPDKILTGFAAGEQFGVSVSSGQDINRDGYDDLLIGANLNSVKGARSGRAYLFLGRPILSSYPDRVFNGENPDDHFGISVSLAGDVNGDGFPDFLIGAGGNGTATHQGKAYLYYGEAELGNQPQMTFSGNSPGDSFGRMVQGVKDVNGDGFDDFLIGAPYHASQTGKLEAGEAYLYQGGPNLNSTPDLTLRIPGSIDASHADFGFSAASLGDIPRTAGTPPTPFKDGYADFIIGAYGQITQTGIDPTTGKVITIAAAGEAYLFTGGSTPSPDFVMILGSGNNGSNESFGVSLSSPGDFDGDGYADLIIGAMTADQAKGRAYYYNGVNLPKTSQDWTLYGSAAQEGFGFGVR
ncbi:MAG: FG-GAP repeat protein [Nitrospirae bacterium]|nr:FG-GAP repeat protein [Nitrospirota bacterium]MBI3352162.1 FG-GAP repeat protein [Nitrospirota bacterium]